MARRSGLLAGLALSAIRAYQRHLSPHKGFCCAYRRATGRDGCSGYGYRVIARFGLGPGLVLLRRRLRLCGEVHRSRVHIHNPVLHHQRGDCVPCDCDAGCVPDLPCNVPGGSWRDADCLCDACQCADCGDPKRAWRDWKERRRLRRQRRIFS